MSRLSSVRARELGLSIALGYAQGIGPTAIGQQILALHPEIHLSAPTMLATCDLFDRLAGFTLFGFLLHVMNLRASRCRGAAPGEPPAWILLSLV